MRIINDCSFLNVAGIKIIEKKYNAKYVFESPLKTANGNWTDDSYAIFYTEQPHPEGSNYFGIHYRDEGWFIVNGLSATEEAFSGIDIDGDVIYSRYRHDFRPHKGIFVDGGRDYLRWGGARMSEGKAVKLAVNRDKLEIVE